MSTEESKAISKFFELEFEDPAFSIKPPKLDGFMLRHAKEKDRVKAVNASEKSNMQTQLKIMDIAPPHFDLYTKCVFSKGEGGGAEAQAKDSVKAVLHQWGRAFHHITQKRRRTIVALVEPAYDFILSNLDTFFPGKEATQRTHASSSAVPARAKAWGKKD